MRVIGAEHRMDEIDALGIERELCRLVAPSRCLIEIDPLAFDVRGRRCEQCERATAPVQQRSDALLRRELRNRPVEANQRDALVGGEREKAASRGVQCCNVGRDLRMVEDMSFGIDVEQQQRLGLIDDRERERGSGVSDREIDRIGRAEDDRFAMAIEGRPEPESAVAGRGQRGNRVFADGEHDDRADMDPRCDRRQRFRDDRFCDRYGHRNGRRRGHGFGAARR